MAAEESEALTKPAFSSWRPRRGWAHLSSMPGCPGLGSLAKSLLQDFSHQSGPPMCCPSSISHLSLSVYAVLAPGPPPRQPLKAIVANAARDDSVLSQHSPLFLSGERPMEVISPGSLSLSCPKGLAWSPNPSPLKAIDSLSTPDSGLLVPSLGMRLLPYSFSIPCPLLPPPPPLQTGLGCLTSTT